MSDSTDPGVEALLATVRNIEPTDAEVARAVRSLRSRPRRPRSSIWTAGVAVVAALALLVLSRLDPPEPASALRRVQPPRSAIVLDGAAPRGLWVDGERVIVSGVAVVVPKHDGLRLDEGEIDVEGRTQVRSINAAVSVQGEARIRLDGLLSIAVVIVAGTVEISSAPEVVCVVEELEPPRESSGPADTTPPGEQPAVEQTPSTPTSSSLQAQTREYRAARALVAQSPRRALRAFEAFRVRHPRSALRPEADLEVISLATRLGRHERARREASRFLARHPNSPRAAELRAITRSAPP